MFFTKKITNETKFFMFIITGASLFGTKVVYSKLRYVPFAFKHQNSEIDTLLIQ